MKKVLSWILVFVSLAAACAFPSSFAEEKDGEGLVEIASLSDLEALKDRPDAHAILMNDLTLSEDDWKPIGDSDRPFSGIFDGNGHTVTLDIKFKASGKGVLAGLFGVLTGSVKRLRVTGSVSATIDSGYIGALAAVLTGGGSLFSCRSEAELEVNCRSASAVGGLVGAVLFSGAENDGSILCCRHTGPVSATVSANPSGDSGPLSVGTNGALGGILGFVADNAHAVVAKCVNEGNITVKGGKYNVGGVVGQTCVNSSATGVDLVECANSGDVTVHRIAGERAAGIIGYIKSGNILHCCNTGNIKAYSDDGKTVSRIGYGTHYGIFGYANLGAGNRLTVKNCYNASPDPAEAEIGVLRNPSYGEFENYYMSGREEYETELNASNVGAGAPGKTFTNAADLTQKLTSSGSFYSAAFDGQGNALWPRLSFEAGRKTPLTGNVSFFGTVRERRDSFDLRLIVHLNKSLIGGKLNVAFVLPNGTEQTFSYVVGRDLTAKDRIYADNAPYLPEENCLFYVKVYENLPKGYFKTIKLSFEEGETKKTAEAAYGAFLTETAPAETGLEGLPAYPDGKASAVYNAGPGLENDKVKTVKTDCREIVISETTAASFKSYLETLKNNGFEQIFENRIDSNEYRMVEKNGEKFYLYFTANAGETRIIADKASTVTVSELSNGAGTGQARFYQYAIDYTKNAKQTSEDDYWAINCGMFYIIRLADNSLFLVDGGHKRQSSNAALEALNGFLHEITNTPDNERVKISGWFFSHAHGDHVYLSHAFLEKYHDLYDLRTVFCNFPSYQTIPSGYDAGTFLLKDTINSFYPGCDCCKLHTGQTFSLPGADFEVLYTHEDAVRKGTGKTEISDFNDTSTVLRVKIGGKKVMLLGDTSGVAEAKLQKNYTRKTLKSDAVQLAHHCINNLSGLYHTIAAPLLLCPNSKENVDAMASNRQSAVSAAGKSFSGILYGDEYTYRLTFDQESIGFEIERENYRKGLYFDFPAGCGAFTGDKAAETPLGKEALNGLKDLSGLIIDKSAKGTPGTGADEAPQLLFDGSTGTKWCENTSKNPYVMFKTKTPVSVAAYALYAANDSDVRKERNPECWTLWGSSNGEDWTVIDSVFNGQMNTAKFSASVYASTSGDEKFSFFVLAIHSTSDGGSTMQLSEFKLYGND